MIVINEEEDPHPATHAHDSAPHDHGIAQDISQRVNGSDTPPSTQPVSDKGGFLSWIQGRFKFRPDSTLRETIEEYIEDDNGGDNDEENSISLHEKTLISNVLKLKDTTIVDVMVPRADILAVEVGISPQDLLHCFAENHLSRIPVYQDNLDDVLGTIHIKDVLTALAHNKDIVIKDLIRDIPIMSPSMPVLDLLLEMRRSRKHMVLVVDEYGGVDGLVTIGDVIEEIVGQIEDEHDQDEQPQILVQNDGSSIADARLHLEDFEKEYGCVLEEEEREENDTLGGLMTHIAGRVPARGEVLSHTSGLSFEILEADPRRVARLRIYTARQAAE